MEQLLIDTNIIVEYLKKKEGLLSQIWDHYKLFVSPVAIAELMASKKSGTEEFRKEITELVSKRFEVLPTTQEVAEKAGELLRELDISFAQAITAATALNKEMPLVTYDLTTYDQVPDLKLVDI